jgi:hypothetical protein
MPAAQSGYSPFIRNQPYAAGRSCSMR